MNQEDLRAEIKNCLRESIEEIKKLPAPEPLPDKINLTDAMQLTGLKKSALYKMTMDGTIPHLKYGKRLIFSRKELTTWMEKRTVRNATNEEAASRHLQTEATKRLK
jgi:excisionase family DNA binding protein